MVRAAIMLYLEARSRRRLLFGMTYWSAMRRVVLRPAARVAVPPIANETINLCKATSLVAFVSVPDLLYSVQEIYARTFQVVPLLVVATIWYTVIVSIMTLAQWQLERKLQRSRPVRRSRAVPDLVLVTVPVLEAWNITKRFGPDVAVNKVSLGVEAGTAVCILGPSGAGKTTSSAALTSWNAQTTATFSSTARPSGSPGSVTYSTK